MSDRPIIFSAPMVRALLDGRKTQTRRVLKPQPTMHDAGDCTIRGHRGSVDYLMRDVAPRFWAGYAPGDRLWVREAWRASKDYDAYPPREMSHWPMHYEADGAPDPNDETHMNGRLRSPINMPRWASRLTLIVTDVRVQRVQEISEDDARAEGMPVDHNWKPYDPPPPEVDSWQGYARASFSLCWNEINAKRDFGWDANPWVAAITFRVEPRNIDRLAA